MRDNQAKLILFNELRRGPLSGVEVALYPVRLRAELIREGIAKTREDGGLELVNAASPSSVPPAPSKSGTMPAVSPATMPTLTSRVPLEVLAYLDGLGYDSRSDAARAVMLEAVSKGLGKKRKAS